MHVRSVEYISCKLPQVIVVHSVQHVDLKSVSLSEATTRLCEDGFETQYLYSPVEAKAHKVFFAACSPDPDHVLESHVI